MIVMVIIRVKIVYIGVLMRLVSIRGESLNWTWLPPSNSIGIGIGIRIRIRIIKFKDRDMDIDIDMDMDIDKG